MAWASDRTVDIFGTGARHEEATDTSRGVSGEDGRADPVGAAGESDRAVLSEGGPRPPAVRAAELLRVHCVQLFYNLSDPGMEDLLYEVESVRRFAGLRLTGPLPDETTILHFRHLLERHGLGEALFAEINAHLASPGPAAEDGHDRGREHHRRAEFDEEQGARAGSGDAPDEEGQPVVLRDEGAHRGGRRVGPGAQPGDDGGERRGRVARAPGAARRRGRGLGRRGLPRRRETPGEPGRGRGLACGDEAGQAPAAGQGGRGRGAEKRKASVRAKVEHPFLYVKRHFGYGKVRDRGLAKNTERIAMLLGFANLLIAGRYATG